jgi:hypothetical protein
VGVEAVEAMGGSTLERRVLGLVLVREDRALVDRLRVEWFLVEGNARELLWALKWSPESPDWVSAARAVRQRGLNPFMLDDLAEAVQGHVDDDPEALVAALAGRHATLEAVRAVEVELRLERLVAAVDRVRA